MKKSDIVALPLSMRIIRLLINSELTTKEIKNALNDIPQATLYRHIKKMHAVDLLKVVKEEIVKGITKKTYTFNKGMVTREDTKKMTKEEFENLFIQFMALLSSDFQNNLENNINFKEDVNFSQAPIYLSKKESESMNQEINDIIKKYIKNKKTENREQMILSITFMPNK